MSALGSAFMHYFERDLRGLHAAGQQATLRPEWVSEAYGSADDAVSILAKRHPSFLVRRMCDDSVLLTKRACISRNRWL